MRHSLLGCFISNGFIIVRNESIVINDWVYIFIILFINSIKSNIYEGYFGD